MKRSTKIILIILGNLFLITLGSAYLISVYFSTTVVTVDNSSGYVLTNIEINVAGEFLTDPKIGIFHIVPYKIKNQREGSISFEAILNNERISKEFGYVTQNMREEYLIHVRNADEIGIYGQ